MTDCQRPAVRGGVVRRLRHLPAAGLVVGGVVVAAVGATGAAAVAGRPDPMPVALPSAGGSTAAGGGTAGGGDPQVPCDPNRLIAAINLANADQGGTLQLARRCTYTLTANQDGDGLPPIRQPIRIVGQGATIVRAADAAAFRIFDVAAGGRLSLDGLTVTGGLDRTADGGAGLLVRAGGRVDISDTVITRNQAILDGGAIANSGTATISGADLDDNSAGRDGAGIENRTGGSLRVQASRFVGNVAGSSGGAVHNLGTVELDGSTLSSNRADRGGALRTGSGTAAISDSTITANASAVTGGAVQSEGRLLISDSSIGQNTAGGSGGAIFTSGTTATLVVEGTDIAGNSTRADGAGLYNSSGRVVLRGGRIRENNAVGPASMAGGIVNNGGSVDLNAADVLGNASAEAPGGIFTNNTNVTADDPTLIVANRPTNCQGSGSPVPHCFG